MAAALLHSVRRCGVWRSLLFAALALWTIRLSVLGYVYAAGGSVRRHHIESGTAVLVGTGLVLVALFRRKGDASGRAAASSVVVPLSWVLALALILTSVALLLFAPGLRTGLLSDDFSLLKLATRGNFASWRSGWHVRPLPLIVWWALSSFARDPSVPMHVANVVLHGVNATLVCGLARRLGLSTSAALLAGMFFVAYPAAVEGVVWCSGLQDVLMTTAALAFVHTWMGRGPALLRLALIMAWLAMGLATKETAVVIPLLGFVVAWSPGGPRRREGLILTLCTSLVAGIFAAWRLSLGGSSGHLKWPPTFYDLQCLAARPFGTLAAPWSSAALDTAPWLLALSIAAGSILLFGAFLRWSDGKVAGYGLALRLALWILLAAVPTYGLLYVGPDLQGSRYTYLPAAGGAILLALILDTAVGSGRHSRTVLWAVAGAALAVSVFGLRVHIRAWEDAAALRDSTIAAALRAARSRPGATLAFENLPDNRGGAYVFRNGFDAAIDRAAPDVAARLVLPERAACRFRFDGSAFSETH